MVNGGWHAIRREFRSERVGPGGRGDARGLRTAVNGCRQGRRVDRYPDPRVVSFYRAITASYPDRHPGPNTPWAVAPLHAAHDHVELNLHPTCADQVLLDIERLAGSTG